MNTTVRIAHPEFSLMRKLLFSRYPSAEWVTFARFGWRSSPQGLCLTLAGISEPAPGDLDSSVDFVRILEPYSLRIALAAEREPLAVGVIHSHPQGCWPVASIVDDDMDQYYSKYFADFAPGRPYISLIFSEIEGALCASGRVWHQGTWLQVDQFKIERTPVETYGAYKREATAGNSPHAERMRRFTDAFGLESADRLRKSCVAVIGAGGTGSAVIEVLARAGVGKLIVVDPESVEESNLERLHGGCSQDVHDGRLKVDVARRHVAAIDSSIDFVGLVGRLPQEEVIDRVVEADLAIGCTDRGHSRLALGEIAWRFLVPAIDVGVCLEGDGGRVSAQVLQLVTFKGSQPCPICTRMINTTRVSQELMSPEERVQRMLAAQEAVARGEDPNPYWTSVPQLNTVGYLTTAAGALAAGYAIGWITARFDTPFSRLQANLVAQLLDTTDSAREAAPECACQVRRGWADQAKVWSQISAPEHWPKPYLI